MDHMLKDDGLLKLILANVTDKILALRIYQFLEPVVEMHR